MSKAEVTMEVGNDGVAVITMSNPPVNALALAIIAGLKEKYAEAMRRNDVKAIVVTGKGGRFSGGFDINVFQKVHKTADISHLPDASIDLLVNTVEDAKKPSVAAVEGLALGGGLEVAMACHARIAAPKTQLGLPELSLGVMPGFGGTQRLPRLVGLSKAVEMMRLSKSISSEEGYKLGLVDAIVSSEELLKVSRRWALDIVDKRKPWVRSLHQTEKLGSVSEALDILKISRQQARKTVPHLPQHQACLDVIEEGIVHGGYSGLLKETKVFNELVLSDTAKGLIHVFFAQRTTSKVPNVTDIGLKPRNVKKVAVIGGGLMGSGIATALITTNVQGLVTKGKLTQDKAHKALSMLKGVLDYSEFKDIDMVIECSHLQAVIENIPLKQKIFSEIEKICSPHCILATNTSTIDLNLVGEKTSSQDRIIGAHFFSPAHVMPLLEVVRTEKTSAQVILDLMTVGKAIKKIPVVVGSCTGLPSIGLSSHMHKVHIFGQFRLQDLSGYGVAVAVGKEFATAFQGRTFESPLVNLLLKNGGMVLKDYCKQNGKGYYIYEKGSKPRPDPSVLPIIEESRRLANIMPGGKPISVTNQEILEMILFPVVNEACRVLDEGVVVRASDLDITSVLGMSFPSYRGGIVFWADEVGPYYIYTCLKKWSAMYGTFFKPSSYLEQRATKGIPLSAPASASPASNSRL
ncbi:Peroxisomal fatty acid beta-oxidation multifunctional protein AIM1 [Vitis vinifera]|uniref:Peroxisomal fatty acid beta-oxidation multifunctional protein AIM1 n=1 Tax=Vitis vinifera TaxID=29760 RepID=A0A438DSA2_VITVI|nr:Peroxisomal fatty acid beta-oxidation multifunctional protein AIM1 [Vitis vinifera]